MMRLFACMISSVELSGCDVTTSKSCLSYVCIMCATSCAPLEMRCVWEDSAVYVLQVQRKCDDLAEA